MDVSAFELLHPKVQDVTLAMEWSRLYPIQERAIREFSDGDQDLILSAPTSGGKTEGAFLPIVSRVLDRPGQSIQVLCVSPLKALINDQFERLSRLCQSLGIPVHRWHGDVDDAAKKRLRLRPRGILFTTPESIESGFVNHSHRVRELYRQLDFVVIDELHVLLESERGAHVRSLLSRLFQAIERRPRLIALSATLGHPEAARGFLNVDHPDSVMVIEDRSTARPIDVTVIGVAETKVALPDSVASAENSPVRKHAGALGVIASDISATLNGGSYLVFANSRRTVEELGDLLRRGGGAVELNDEPMLALHHGSLSAKVRKNTERQLKSGTPTRAICTSSLELGIDIGYVDAVAQVDAPWSVSSLAQRLGRSGRREGSTSKLRLYVRCSTPAKDATIVDLIRPRLLQGIAMVSLLLRGWLEPLQPDRMHLSTLVHQILSVLKETGGQRVLEVYRSLCQRGPFRRVGPDDFKILLRGLHAHGLVDQDAEGVLLLGMEGERISSGPGFYAAFTTPIELNVRSKGKDLGRIPVTAGLKKDDCLMLNGHRWLIDRIDWVAKTIWVSPTNRKKPTVFLGGVGDVHDEIFMEMRRVLRGTDEPEWLDDTSLDALRSARAAAAAAGLDRSDISEDEGGVLWFPWVGTRTFMTLQLLLPCTKAGIALAFDDADPEALIKHFKAIESGEIDPVQLASLMEQKRFEKYDRYVPDALLDKANATDRLDLPGALKAIRRTLGEHGALKVEVSPDKPGTQGSEQTHFVNDNQFKATMPGQAMAPSTAKPCGE